ncbi:ABC transporter permease subunit [Arabiibacter massiliensis]|uniref:ABC transporter permease subunit n=1 Tax=Arabiibacter massiliensis TaxID=1870985 RepID=UPI0009B9ADD1|nr:ABC transporter permease subunit [Arabiibacter massiliensis]
MNKTLFAKELRANLFVFTVVFAVLVMYIAVIVSMFDPELGRSLDMMMASMPELFAAFGMAEQATTLTDFMLNYLYGFLLTIFPFVLIVIMANKLMVRYLDRGTMSYLLATPNSRTRIAATLAAVMVTLLAALAVLTTLAEVGCAELMFPGDLDAEGIVRANVGVLALWVFLAGMCFLSACLFANASAALWVGGGAGILFFLMQMVSQVGDKFEFLENVNPLTLFDYYGLAANESGAVAGAAALAALGLALFAAAIAVFARRNLSI